MKKYDTIRIMKIENAGQNIRLGAHAVMRDVLNKEITAKDMSIWVPLQTSAIIYFEKKLYQS